MRSLCGVILAWVAMAALVAAESTAPRFGPGVVAADLRKLLDPAARAPVAVEVAQFGGGSVTAHRPLVLVKDAGVEAQGDGVAVTFSRETGLIEATPGALGLPENWSAYASLVVTWSTSGTSSTDTPEVVAAVMLPRGRLLADARAAKPGEYTVEVDLTDMPLASGKAALFTALGVRLAFKDGAAPLSRPHRLVLRRIELRPRVQPRGAVVDALGQRRSRTWPGKVASVAELAVRRREEGAQLAAASTRADLDAYGGWKQGPRFAATGFFHVAQDPAGRWWLVTPEGNPFWSIGTTGVRISSVNDTQIAKGREELFADLPPAGDPAWFSGRQWNTLGDVVVPGNVHFYRWNVLRKYGDPLTWRDRVLDRWQAWGLNTVGSWSDDVVLEQQRVPHTRFLRARAEVPGVSSIRGFPDVWNPRWAESLEREFAATTRVARQNPWLLGYFVDNEAHWSDMRLLDMAPEATLRAEWRAFAEARCGTVERFNAIHGTRCASWADVQALTTAELPARGAANAGAAELMRAFEAEYAERYFSTVARILKAQDPNHLYLGCRFVRNPPADGIVRAAGRHADVLSVNCYSVVPQREAFARWHALSGRPILIGEFHFPLASERQLLPQWEAFTAVERERMFVEYVRAWAEQPWSLGCHSYQHADQPLLGRHTDGENQTVGFVDVADQPYDHLVRAAQKATQSMYEWHAGR